MAKKINLNFMLVIGVSVLLSVFLTTMVSYRLFRQEVFSDLSAFAKMIEDLDFLKQMKDVDFTKPEDPLRITWIDDTGAVLFDSYTHDSDLGNHGDRPEVKQAKRKGEGFCIRKSRTMDRNLFFYARRSGDGKVIRIAKETGSIWNVYRSTLPVTLCVVIFSFLFSLWLARYLTKLFIKPMEQMAADMDYLEEVPTYPEIMPLIEQIRSQHQEMIQAARVKEEFTANVSHELKTPLTSISGYSELIASGMASKKEGRHFAEEIHRNAQRLLTLINDILQLSELDALPEHRSNFVSVDLYETAARCMDVLQPVAEKQQVQLSLKGASLQIQADPELVEELIYNLCDNALRYNRPGGHVWITVTDRLIVQDDGIGIPKKFQKRIFERFFRVDKSRSKKTGGTGLGLAIVKHIAEAHDAVVFLDSDEGIGTTISVSFPPHSSE